MLFVNSSCCSAWSVDIEINRFIELRLEMDTFGNKYVGRKHFVEILTQNDWSQWRQHWRNITRIHVLKVSFIKLFFCSGTHHHGASQTHFWLSTVLNFSSFSMYWFKNFIEKTKAKPQQSYIFSKKWKENNHCFLTNSWSSAKMFKRKF